MTQHYRQLTQEGRYHIYALRKAGYRQKAIACEVGVHPSTVSRELLRNCGERGYRAIQAHEKAVTRRKSAFKRVKFTSEVEGIVTEKLRLDWSPEQISGWIKREGLPGVQVSHERIYQYVVADRKEGGTLYNHLRQGKRKYRKRYGRGWDRRGQNRNRRDIKERPQVVDKRSRIGDWEGDTIIGSSKKKGLP